MVFLLTCILSEKMSDCCMEEEDNVVHFCMNKYKNILGFSFLEENFGANICSLTFDVVEERRTIVEDLDSCGSVGIVSGAYDMMCGCWFVMISLVRSDVD